MYMIVRMGQNSDDYPGFQQIPDMPILLQQSVAIYCFCLFFMNKSLIKPGQKLYHYFEYGLNFALNFKAWEIINFMILLFLITLFVLLMFFRLGQWQSVGPSG